MKPFAFMILAALIIGCSKTGENEINKSSEAKRETPSTLAKDAIEGLTGKTAVDQGEKAKDKIRAISAEQKNELNEVLDNK